MSCQNTFDSCNIFGIQKSLFILVFILWFYIIFPLVKAKVEYQVAKNRKKMVSQNKMGYVLLISNQKLITIFFRSKVLAGILAFEVLPCNIFCTYFSIFSPQSRLVSFFKVRIKISEANEIGISNSNLFLSSENNSL